MKIVTLPPGKGKTTKLIEICHDLNQPTGRREDGPLDRKGSCYMVVPMVKDANIVAELAVKMGKRVPYPLTFSEFLNHKYYHPSIKALVVDNVDLLLSWLSDIPVVAISVTSR